MADKKKVLIIDDEEDICAFTKSMLERSGRFEVITSTDSQTAISLAKNNRPDIVLLDINMPLMDGGEVAQSIRDFQPISQIPIIFITALLKKEELDAQAGGKIGRNYFLAKPIAPQELISKIDSILQKPD
ncbi:MAG TPA: response regulator [Candidatus Omnitrophota bacterium]|nr:response regulator [Candidatus Omnitrophota bacterium]HRZ14354.1 response regulator [Candidatus Omnitrophota bacterium]